MLTLVTFAVIFEMLSLTGSHVFRSPDWTPLLFVAYAFATSLVGRALAYFTIFEFVRFWFTKVVSHSSGVGEDVNPIPANQRSPVLHIVREVIGVWICCPICSGVWGALGLALMYTVDPTGGRFIIFVLGAGGFAMILTRLAETIEWASRYLHEMTGHWNRVNKIELETETLTTVQSIEIHTSGQRDGSFLYYYEDEPMH